MLSALDRAFVFSLPGCKLQPCRFFFAFARAEVLGYLAGSLRICRINSMTTTTTAIYRLTLLLADTDGTTSSAGSLGVLTSDTETPVVTQTTVGSDLLETFQILTQLAFHAVCQNLRVLAVHDIALSVEEPRWDLVLGRVLDDGEDSFEFF